MLRDNTPISTDSDLARLICEYVHNIPTIAKVLTIQDVIDVSIMKTVVSVGYILLVCAILFCTDDRCSISLHTLLTDTIESQGGSTLLVQMLNRLGVCASIDTISHFKMSI